MSSLFVSIYLLIPLICKATDLPDRQLVKPRIFAGKTVSIQELGGYAVQIYNSSRMSCAGTLLTRFHILSAAHCFGKATADLRKFHVIAGRTNSESFFYPNEELNFVAKLKIHPSYNKLKFIADIAVIKVSMAIRNAEVQYLPVCTQDLTPGTMATVSGWGVSEMTKIQNPLRSIRVPIISNEACNEKMGRQMPPNVICAAGYNQQTICSGDSGGPLVVRGEVCGVSTWTYSCGNDHMPDIFMNVNFYSQFINRSISQLGF